MNNSIGILALMILGVIILGVLIEILILVHRQDKKIRELRQQSSLIERAITDEYKETK